MVTLTTAVLQSTHSDSATRAPQTLHRDSLSESWIFFVVRSTPTTPVLWMPIVGAPQGILRLAILCLRKPDATSAVSP